MKRGEIWTIAGGPAYAGKPRPVVIIQDDRYDATDSVTVCPLTTNHVDAPLIRIELAATELNGLRNNSYAMADKVTTVRRGLLGEAIGQTSDEDLLRIGRAALVFLGLVG